MTQIQTVAGIQISYDSNKEKTIKENLSSLIDIIRAGDILVGFHISPYLLVISSMIQVDSIKDERVIASLVFAAGVEIQGSQDIELQVFFETLGRKAYDYVRKPTQEYHLLYPLNILRAKIPFGQIVIGQETFEVLTWEEAGKKYNVPKLQTEINNSIHFPHEQELWNHQGSVLILKIYSRSAEDAFRIGEKAFDKLLSSINYILDTSISIRLNEASPHAKVIPSVGYGVFRPTGELDCPYTDIDFLNKQKLCSEQIDPNELQVLLSLINSTRRTDQRFIEALSEHNNGLKTTNWDTAFLSFWRVFEILSFGARTDYNMSDVVKRTCTLLRDNVNTQSFLNLCAIRRNSLVHQGIFSPEAEPLVLTIKFYSKRCLMKYENLIHFLKTEYMVEKYYELANLNSDQLNEQQLVIQAILNERAG